MDIIIEQYYLEPGSKLVNHEEGTNGVNCWFDNGRWIQHRCLTFEHFKLIQE